MKSTATHLLLTLSLLAPAWADGPRIEASLQQPRVGLQESAVLALTITGSVSVSEPRFPPLPQFDTHLSQQSQQTVVENGVLASSLTLRYILTPKQAGTFPIGPITTEVDGQTVSTQPLQLQVLADSQALPAPAAADRGPAYVTAEVDNLHPYVGQAVTYKLRFFHTAGVTLAGQPQLPTTTGFLSQPAKAEKTYSAGAYEVNEVTFTLIPSSPGRLQIGSARVPCHLPLEDDSDVFNLLNNGGEQALTTDPISLEVQSPPSLGRPADFTGGIGRFTLQARLDSAPARVGQPLELEFSLAGKGLELVGAPQLPALADFRVLGVEAARSSPEGTRKFTATLVPTRAGQLEIPAISMASFDPDSKQYVSTSSQPLTLEVAPAAAQPNTSSLENELRPQHPSAAAPSELMFSPRFWALQGVPLAILLAALSPRRWPRPARLRAALGDPLLPTVHGFLSQKLGQSVAGLGAAELAALLRDRGARPAQVDRLVQMLERAEQVRYSGTGDTTLDAQAISLLRELERNLS